MLRTSLITSARCRPHTKMTPHLERIRSSAECHQWHVKDGDYGAHDPCFEVQTPEPILLHWARIENE